MVRLERRQPLWHSHLLPVRIPLPLDWGLLWQFTESAHVVVPAQCTRVARILIGHRLRVVEVRLLADVFLLGRPCRRRLQYLEQLLIALDLLLVALNLFFHGKGLDQLQLSSGRRFATLLQQELFQDRCIPGSFLALFRAD